MYVNLQKTTKRPDIRRTDNVNSRIDPFRNFVLGSASHVFAYRGTKVFAGILADEPTGYWRLTDASGSAAATEAAAVLHPWI